MQYFICVTISNLDLCFVVRVIYFSHSEMTIISLALFVFGAADFSLYLEVLSNIFQNYHVTLTYIYGNMSSLENMDRHVQPP